MQPQASDLHTSVQRLRWLPTALLAGGAAAATLILRRVDPNQPGNPLPGCPFSLLTGIYCPGCGSTRCLHALVHGDIPTALTMNPLLVISLPVLALMTLSAAGWNPPQLAGFRRFVGNPKLWLWLLTGYWIARNLPWPPFNWLAPG
ncbi:hypothetical protein CO614_04165 [Lysobacteraceae bacterium NML120232]|nr:hypothetical protein CO608_03025 [Xanthomonadaceae bacterium NML08-0793]PJK12757.1 hypothetical protein CO614_04165 [Xanthomonadaceae bacterium NML120232]